MGLSWFAEVSDISKQHSCAPKLEVEPGSGTALHPSVVAKEVCMRQVNSEWCADLMAWTDKCKVTRKSYLLVQNSTEVQLGCQEHPRKDYSLPGIEVTWTHKLFNVFSYQKKEKKPQNILSGKKPEQNQTKKK